MWVHTGRHTAHSSLVLGMLPEVREIVVVDRKALAALPRRPGQI